MVVSRLAWRSVVSKLCGCSSVRSCMGSSASADRDDFSETAEDSMDQVETKVDFDRTKSICHSTGIPLRSPLPSGTGFATGHISLGEVDLIQVSTFEEVWSALEGGSDNKGVTLYKPIEVPAGYHVLCHYGQRNSLPRVGWVLAIKETETCLTDFFSPPPASSSPTTLPQGTPKKSAGLSLSAAEGAAVSGHEAVSGAVSGDEAKEDLPSSPSKSKKDIETCPSPSTLASEETPKQFAGLSLGAAKGAAVSGAGSGDEAEENSPRSPSKSKHSFKISSSLPALKKPVDFRLVWKSCSWGGQQVGIGWIWLPQPPEGYATLGYVVTNTEEKPGLDEVTCVRTDLTEACTVDGNIFTTTSSSDDDDKVSVSPFSIWRTRPAVRGISATGVNVGSFYCAQSEEVEDTTSTLPVVCLKNVNFKLDAMPTLAQVRSIQQYHGSTLVFHPKENFLPSSVSWFFEAGAMLYTNDTTNPPPQRINSDGSNLPQGGTNDNAFWIDLPSDGTEDEVKKGNLESAEAYVHVKPVYGGTFTDLQTWEFFPFNGPSVAKVGKLTIALGHVGEHVGDWEHHTLRISNFTGELEAVYFSQHSGGNWVRPFDLEYVTGNKQVVYVAKNGHPCYAHAGDHLQGDERRGIGLKNDTAMSTLLLNCAEKYQIISAEYMHVRGDPDAPEEPAWLQYMREWGPKIEYDRKKYLDKMLKFLPSKLRASVEDVINKLPDEVMGQEGPTGPKEKNMWFGDERGSFLS